MTMRVLPSISPGVSSGVNLDFAVARPAGLITGLLWSNRRSFVPGLTFALGRILAIAAFPIIFKDIIDRLMPQKNLAGILYE